MEMEEVINRARSAYLNSIPGYSNFRVGAALVTKDGKIYTGCNIEASTSLGICAERVAILKALSEGERHFTKLLILTEGGEYCSPCGSCRQMLWEYAPDLEVLMINSAGQILSKMISELLPMAFNRKKLNNHVAV